MTDGANGFELQNAYSFPTFRFVSGHDFYGRVKMLYNYQLCGDNKSPLFFSSIVDGQRSTLPFRSLSFILNNHLEWT